MTKIVWNRVGERIFETGVDRGVLYPNGGDGVAWNGLISVDESPTGGETRSYYIDGFKYLHISGPEEFAATIQAFTYPKEFEVCNAVSSPARGLYLGQQNRSSFGLCYRTGVGNDIAGANYGYKLHLVYNALTTPSPKSYSTSSDSPEPINFSWDLTTKAILTDGHKPVSNIVIDSTEVTPPLMAALEAILYGTGTTNPRLPSPSEVIALFTGWPTLYVVDNGDGTFTISGPDEVVRLINTTTFEINAPTAVDNGDGTFEVTSY